jgi:hypothetical protein
MDVDMNMDTGTDRKLTWILMEMDTDMDMEELVEVLAKASGN